VQPDAHVDIGITAIMPKTYITADRQRMDVYRRLTRCTDLAMLGELQKDVTDAFGELPQQAEVLFALTELRLLAGMYGIESIIRKDPDVVLKVREANKAQSVLLAAPGSLRVIDETTVYLRPPAVYLQPETLLIMLRNLMRTAHDLIEKGEPPPGPPEPQKPPPGAKSLPHQPQSQRGRPVGAAGQRYGQPGQGRR
jgi:transcription-repair coupling factor (superfamily II helicase)